MFYLFAKQCIHENGQVCGGKGGRPFLGLVQNGLYVFNYILNSEHWSSEIAYIYIHLQSLQYFNECNYGAFWDKEITCSLL